MNSTCAPLPSVAHTNYNRGGRNSRDHNNETISLTFPQCSCDESFKNGEAYKSPKLHAENCSSSSRWSNENLPPNGRAKCKTRRLVLKIKKMKSISCLQERNKSLNPSEGKTCSKRPIKNNRLNGRKFSLANFYFKSHSKFAENSETESQEILNSEVNNDSTYVTNKNQSASVYGVKETGIREAVVCLESGNHSRTYSSICKAMGSESLSKDIEITEDRTTGDALISYPLELVEIYSGKIERVDSLNCKNDESDVAHKQISMRSFPRGNESLTDLISLDTSFLSAQKSTDFKEELWPIDLGITNCNDTFIVKNCRESATQQDRASMENNYRTPSQLRISDVSVVPTRDLQCDEVTKVRVESGKRTKNMHINCQSNARKIVLPSGDGRSVNNSTTLVDEGKSRILISQKPVESTVKNDSNVYKSDYLYIGQSKQEINREYSNIYNSDSFVIKDRSDSGVFNQSLKSIDSGNQERFDKTTFSENVKTVVPFVIQQEAAKERSITKISDSQAPKKLKNCNLNSEQTLEVNNTERRVNQSSQDEIQKMRNIQNKLVKREQIIEQENVDCNDLNVCKALAEIHMQLTNNWQKVENLRAKLLDTAMINWITSTVTIQLLGNTVSRCKNYVLNSDNAAEATMTINKMLSKYVVRLKEAVNEENVALQEEEKQYRNMHLQSNEKMNVSKDNKKSSRAVIPTLNDRKNGIFNLVETISNLTKHMLIESEEKENVNNTRKYKSIYCRTTSNLSNNNRDKVGTCKTKDAKVSLPKTKSSIETQSGVHSYDRNKESKLKTCTKTMHDLKNQQKKKITNDMQIVSTDKKCHELSNRRLEKGNLTRKSDSCNTASNQSKQTVSRQKHRGSNNVQPVWKPGGFVRIPSSSSATSLVQRSRQLSYIHGKEKINQLDNPREAKQRKGKNELNKEHAPEIYSTTNDKPSKLDVDAFKISDQCSISNLKANSRLKSKPVTPRFVSKQDDKSVRRNTQVGDQKTCENVSSCEEITTRKRISKESELRSFPEKAIKFQAKGKIKETERDEQASLATRVQWPDRKTFQTTEKSIEKEIKTSEDEPIRDNAPIKVGRIIEEIFQPNKESLSTDKLSRNLYPVSPIVSRYYNKLSITNNTEENAVAKIISNTDNKSRSNLRFSAVSLANASCTADFSSSSESPRIVTSKCCQTSLNSVLSNMSNMSASQMTYVKRDEMYENQGEKCTGILSVANDEKQETCKAEELKSSTSSVKGKSKDNICNTCTISLDILKNFLYCQGVNIDLVNRAESQLKEKQKTGHKGFRKKSTISAKVSSDFSMENNVLRKMMSGEQTDKTGGEEIEKIKNNQLDIDDYKDRNVDYNKSINNIKSPIEQYKLTQKDAATNTIVNSNEVSCQTSFLEKSTKSLQTFLEETSFTSTERQIAETQTRIFSVQQVATECSESVFQRNSTAVGDASTMTETPWKEVNDNCTETTKSIFVSKSIITEEPVPSVDVSSQEFTIDSRSSINKYCCNSNRVLGGSCENYENDFTISRRTSYEKNRLRFVKSYDSLSSSRSTDTFSEFPEKSEENQTTNDESDRCSINHVSSELITALQIAAIRGRNIHRAINIYMESMWRTVEKPGKQINEGNNSVQTETRRRRRRPRKIPRSNSNSDASVSERLRRDSSSRSRITKKMSENISTDLSFDSCDRRDKSDESDSTLENLKITSSCTCRNVDVKSSSCSVVLTDVKSLMEFLLRRTEDKKQGETYYLQKVSCTGKSCSSCTELCEKRTETLECVSKSNVFSRENLLPLVYGVLCSIVFWCLQFSITCDLGTSPAS